MEDDLPGEAAQMAFYFFLSLFPLVVVVFAITGIVGGDEAFATIVNTAERTVPGYARQLVRELVREITERDRPGLLSFGVVFTTWAASNGVAALTKGLNTIYDVSEPRPWWKRRLVALAVLCAGVLFLVIGTVVVVPSAAWLSGRGLHSAWAVARWPLAFVFVTGAVWLSYRYLPARDQRGSRAETLVGALFATLLWIVTVLLFRVYLRHFSSYGATYGALGAIIALAIWFYLGAFVVLLGAELAAVIERHRATPA